MQVKGLVTKSIAEYVKANYPRQYVEWENLLPPKTAQILDRHLNLHRWFDIQNGAEKPTEAIAQLFTNNDVVKAAWQSGRYSAERAFHGVFKMFLLIISPRFIVKRIPRLFGTFYKPDEAEATMVTPNKVVMRVLNMKSRSAIIEYRIAGWLERAFELSGCEKVKVEVIKSFAKGENYTEYEISWD